MIINHTIFDNIINLIDKNKISSVEVADALNKTGVLNDLYSLNPGKFVVGKVKYIYTYNESNWPLHEQIKDVEEDCILYIDAFECNNRALFGDIVSKVLMLYKKSRALVIDGFLRDAHRLRKENYPIWLKGVTPLGCFNKKVSLSDNIKYKMEERKKIFDDSIMVCDDSGCTIITKKNINENFYKKLEFIELQEDIWYYCVDTLKWSTFETICMKNYLKDENILPKILKDKLEEYQK